MSVSSLRDFLLDQDMGLVAPMDDGFFEHENNALPDEDAEHFAPLLPEHENDPNHDRAGLPDQLHHQPPTDELHPHDQAGPAPAQPTVVNRTDPLPPFTPADQLAHSPASHTRPRSPSIASADSQDLSDEDQAIHLALIRENANVWNEGRRVDHAAGIGSGSNSVSRGSEHDRRDGGETDSIASASSRSLGDWAEDDHGSDYGVPSEDEDGADSNRPRRFDPTGVNLGIHRRLHASAGAAGAAGSPPPERMHASLSVAPDPHPDPIPGADPLNAPAPRDYTPPLPDNRAPAPVFPPAPPPEPLERERPPPVDDGGIDDQGDGWGDDDDEPQPAGLLGGVLGMDGNAEMTLEEVLGLRGPWYGILQNTVIISGVIFMAVFSLAWLPYMGGAFILRLCLGNFADRLLQDLWLLFPGQLLPVLVGYFLSAAGLHVYMRLVGRPMLEQIETLPHSIWNTAYLTFAFIKTVVFLACEMIYVPFLCGWWVDAITVPLFGQQLSDRVDFARESPYTAAFLHWLIGMLCMFYIGSAVDCTRQVLRPKLIWFLRDPRHPDFHPVLDILKHTTLFSVRRLMLSSAFLGTVLAILMYLPARVIIPHAFSWLVPFRVRTTAPLMEIPVDFVFYQLVIVRILENWRMADGFTRIVRWWSQIGAWLLGLESYLFGTPLGAETYIRPSWFPLRLALLAAMDAMFGMLCCTTLFVVPSAIGRFVLGLFLTPPFYEMYSFILGVWVLWGSGVAVSGLWETLKQPQALWLLWNIMWLNVRGYVRVALAAGMVGVFVAPMLGLLFDTVVISPLFVPLDMTPDISFPRDIALGIILCRLTYSVTMMMPDNKLQRTLVEVFAHGWQATSLSLLWSGVVLPFLEIIGLFLSLPMAFVWYVLPAADVEPLLVARISRIVHPLCAVVLLLVMVVSSARQMASALQQRVRDEHFLVGQRLVNVGS
jgi:E3 ubiquitin-protein ligase MARCH6